MQLKVGEYDRIRDTDYFTDLCTAEWGSEVAKYALDIWKHRKCNKVNLLPVASDVQKLIGCMRHMWNKYMSDLQQAVDDRCVNKIPSLH